MPEDRVGELRGGGEGLVLVSELAAEELVHGREHLRTRPVVAAQRQQVRRLGAALAEDVDVGMPEPVDRLELVADSEDLGHIGVGDEIHELALQPVRVLELVDHHEAEAQPDRLAHVVFVPEQIARSELEILEVDGRLAPLRTGVLVREALEQLLEQIAVVCGELLEGSALDGLARELVGLGPHAAALQRSEVDDPCRGRAFGHDPGRLGRGVDLGRSRRRVRSESVRLCAERRDRTGEARSLSQLEHELAPGRAERLVDARQHPAEPGRAIRRQEPDALGIAVGAELLERTLERLSAEHGRTRLLELAEARVEPHTERVRLQKPVAETVDRRDPGAVELARKLVAPAVDERSPDPRSELTRGLPRVRDDEDRVDVEARGRRRRVHSARRERTSCPCPRRRRRRRRRRPRPRRAAPRSATWSRLDDRAHARFTRHTGHRSHQDGHTPSHLGSCWTSPARIRWAFAPARSRADSTCVQNSSSSR